MKVVIFAMLSGTTHVFCTSTPDRGLRVHMKPSFSVASSRLVSVATTVGVLLLTSSGPLTAKRASAVPDHADVKTINHVLNRIGYGPRLGDVERVQQMGL